MLFFKYLNKTHNKQFLLVLTLELIMISLRT